MILYIAETKKFLIDAACFPGSSGSPVIMYNTVGYTDKAGNLTLGIADVVRDNEILKIARTDAFTFMKHKIQGV